MNKAELNNIELHKVEVRNACVGDIDAIMDVEREAFIPEINESRSVFLERMNVFPEGFFVLLDEGEVCGYFCCEIWKDVPRGKLSFVLGHSAAASHCYEGGVLYVSSVALLKKCRGRGLGKRMFAECVSRVLQKFPGVRECVLLVCEKWSAARRIYEDMSFCEYGRLEDFFPSAARAFGEGRDSLEKTGGFDCGILMKTDRESLEKSVGNVSGGNV